MINQSFTPVIIKLTNPDSEIIAEGFKAGDILLADREFINGTAKDSVWFKSKRNLENNCVSFLNSDCELITI